MENNNWIRYIIIICYVFVLLSSCQNMRPPHSFLQESEYLRFTDNQYFEYNYYKLNGFELEDSKLFFCKGTYTKTAVNEYLLHPDKFNPDSVNINVQIKKRINISDLTRIILNTSIDNDHSKEYRIILHIGSLSLTFAGLQIDTTLSLKSKNDVNVLVEIILPDFYAYGHPAALYKKISTKPFLLNDAQEINITVPITRDYFYYRDIGTLKVKDIGNYYLFEERGRRIRKK